jgi:gluconate 2-dehydrogenase alpha chain
MSNVIQHDPVDVVLLGMGAMSGAPVIELTLAGYKVVALERGPYWDFATDYYNNKYDEWGIGFLRKFDFPLRVSTASWRNNREQFALPIRRYTFPSHLGQYQAEGFGVGGMTNHYGGMMGRFTPWTYQMYSQTVNRYGLDFLNKAVPHQDIIDWPMTYEDYVPYYETWEKMMGVCGTDQGPLLPGFTNYKYPLPPSPPTPYGDLFKTASEALGYHPFPVPHSLASKSYTNQYGVSVQECFYDGWCGGLCNYVCESGAKANPGWRTVPAALKTGNLDLRTNSYIFRLDTDSAGKVTAARYYDAQGNVNVQPAKVFFNGLWGFNFIKLMLASGIGPAYDPVKITGSVGRGAAFGVSGPKAREAKGTIDSLGANAYTCGNAFGGGYAMLDLADDYFDHTGLDFIGGAYVSAGLYLGGGASSDGGPNNWALFAYTSDSPGPIPDMIGSKWKAQMKDHFLPTKVRMSLQPYGIWPPTTDWFIDLDPHYSDIYGDPIARITLDYGLNTVKAANYLAPFYAEILKKMGASNVTVSDPVSYETHAVSYPAHIRGGARIGSDPALSVFNKWQQCWASENFFGAGEVTEPTGSNTTVGGTHPAGAGSYVAAEGIKKYLQTPGPLV